MKISQILLIITVLIVSSCRTNKQVEKETKLAIRNGKIETCFKAKPSSTIDVQTLKEQYAKYPERWEAAFNFLCSNDLSTYPLGRVDISGDVFASISEYETKAPEDTKYESHQKNVDIQYIITGKEYIELTRDKNLTVTKPYSPKDDIAFYKNQAGQMLEATAKTFFIFFPQDIHRPCISDGQKASVRKVVIKIKYN